MFAVVMVAGNAIAQNWEFMGKVQGVSHISVERDHGEDDLHYFTETLFIYASFDGEKMIYKAVNARTESSYKVSKSSSYNGDRHRWSHNGKYVVYSPALPSMYTHSAGGYYFNMSDVKK